MKAIIAITALLLAASCVADDDVVATEESPDIVCPGIYYAAYVEGNPQAHIVSCERDVIIRWRDQNGVCHSPPTPPSAWYYTRMYFLWENGRLKVVTDRFPLCS